MALLHFAFTFDFDAAHDRILDMAGRDNALDLKALNNYARTIATNASKNLDEILTGFRYEPDWLEDLDQDQSQSYLWYFVALANNFMPCPSLSNNRFHGSHYLLENVLPRVGWSEKEVHELIFGKLLGEIVLAPQYSVFRNALSLLGGALKNEDVAIKLQKLNSMKQELHTTKKIFGRKIREYARYNNSSAEELMTLAYQDAIDMLETTLKRGHAVYLIRSD